MYMLLVVVAHEIHLDMIFTTDVENANTFPITLDPRTPIAHTSDRAGTHATHLESHGLHDQESFFFVCCKVSNMTVMMTLHEF
jgi:hypothetical protein